MISPLRYPGGKSRAKKRILSRIPLGVKEYREPFVGGGSIFLGLAERSPETSIWINDLNPQVYHFWLGVQCFKKDIVREVRRIKRHETNGRDLFERLKAQDESTLSCAGRAVRFFVLNRITFSGTIEAGGYSESAFRDRFTESSINRLEKLDLQGIKITGVGCSQTIARPGKGVFLFLDPPYFSNQKSKLYGRGGKYHEFDHEGLARSLKDSPHDWLLTLDDCPEVREMYSWANIQEWELQYGMNNYQQKKAKPGAELFISHEGHAR